MGNNVDKTTVCLAVIHINHYYFSPQLCTLLWI